MRKRSGAQASTADGRLVWSPINNISHRDLVERRAFVVLSTGNGTALTLTGGHMVYVVDPASRSMTPAPARDVKVRRR